MSEKMPKMENVSEEMFKIKSFFDTVGTRVEFILNNEGMFAPDKINKLRVIQKEFEEMIDKANDLIEKES